MCRLFGRGKNLTLTSDGIMNEKFEWGFYDMMMPIMQGCKRCMNKCNLLYWHLVIMHAIGTHIKTHKVM